MQEVDTCVTSNERVAVDCARRMATDTSADDLSCDSNQAWDLITAPAPPPAVHHDPAERTRLRAAPAGFGIQVFLACPQ